MYPAALPPGEPDHAADEIVGHVQRDRARVDEVAEVLEFHECLDEGLLELGPETMDRVWRRSSASSKILRTDREKSSGG